MPQLSSADGLTLYYEVNQVRSPCAVAVIVHGFGDHCGRYESFAHELNSWGVTCYRFDYRGHGRSEGRRGHVDRFERFLDDLDAVAALAAEDSPQLPHLLLGHSHGGLMVLHSLARDTGPCAWTAAALSSPFFGIALPIPSWKRALGIGLSAVLPSFQLPTEISGESVSHDPEVIKGYDTDKLVGHVASARWFTEVTRALEQGPELARKIKLPIQIQASGDDHLVSLEATRAVYEQLGSERKDLLVYDKLYHEIWFELPEDRASVLRDLRVFMSKWVPLIEERAES